MPIEGSADAATTRMSTQSAIQSVYTLLEIQGMVTARSTVPAPISGIPQYDGPDPTSVEHLQAETAEAVAMRTPPADPLDGEAAGGAHGSRPATGAGAGGRDGIDPRTALLRLQEANPATPIVFVLDSAVSAASFPFVGEPTALQLAHLTATGGAKVVSYGRISRVSRGAAMPSPDSGRKQAKALVAYLARRVAAHRLSMAESPSAVASIHQTAESVLAD